MRILRVLVAVAILLALLQHLTGVHVTDALRQATTSPVHVTTADQRAFDRLCPVLDAYLSVDAAGQAATARSLTSIAAKATKDTQDPAVRAVMTAVPVATSANKVKRDAARALLSRECASHGNPLDR